MAKPSNEVICELLEMVLTCNIFDFDDKHYLQVDGTAMGTKLVPSLANIFVADFEEKFVYPHKANFIIWKQ